LVQATSIPADNEEPNMKIKLAVLSLFVFSTAYAQPRYGEYREYNSTHTEEEDLQTYYHEKDLRDMVSGKKLSLDGTYFGWKRCYAQALEGFVTEK
jgi:hypothetical protein